MKNFSLIELLIVVCILAVLAAILIPNVRLFIEREASEIIIYQEGAIIDINGVDYEVRGHYGNTLILEEVD